MSQENFPLHLLLLLLPSNQEARLSANPHLCEYLLCLSLVFFRLGLHLYHMVICTLFVCLSGMFPTKPFPMSSSHTWLPFPVPGSDRFLDFQLWVTQLQQKSIPPCSQATGTRFVSDLSCSLKKPLESPLSHRRIRKTPLPQAILFSIIFLSLLLHNLFAIKKKGPNFRQTSLP